MRSEHDRQSDEEREQQERDRCRQRPVRVAGPADPHQIDPQANGGQQEHRHRQRGAGQPAPAKRATQDTPKSKAADNPYNRPFGRLSLPDLERQIAETESEIMATQQAIAGAFKDAGKSKSLSKTLDTLSAKLKDLEQEYFLRET